METISVYLLGLRDLASNTSVHTVEINHRGLYERNHA